IARIVSSSARTCGVMIRDNQATDARFAAVISEGTEILGYRNRRGERYRQQFQHEGDWNNRNGIPLPRWVRLRRDGIKLRGYFSWDDGEHWESFFEGPVEMKTNVLIGLFVMSGDRTKLAEARFDHVTVTEAPTREPGGNDSLNHTAVVLRNGTIVV